MSPIERDFWDAWMMLKPPYELKREHKIGRYRVDFAYIPVKVIVELDGHETHSSPMAIANDRRRQRELEALGWHFIRFGGQEIHFDADQCAREAVAFIRKHEPWSFGRMVRDLVSSPEPPTRRRSRRMRRR